MTKKIEAAIKTDSKLEMLFAQAELWKSLAQTPNIPNDMKLEAEQNAKAAYDRAEAYFYTHHA